MKTKRTVIKYSAFLCALAVVLACFSACGRAEDAKTEENYRYGRFVEHDITPEGVSGQNTNLYADGSGWIDIIAREYGADAKHQLVRYTSMDSGAAWNRTVLDFLEQYDVYQTIFDAGPQTGPNISVYSPIPLKNGELLAVVNWWYPDDGYEEYKALRFSAAGEETPFAIDLPQMEGYNLQVTGLSYLPAGRLLYYAWHISPEGRYGSAEYGFFGMADAQTGESIARFEGIQSYNTFYNDTTLFIEDLGAGELSAYLLADGSPVATSLTKEDLDVLRQGGGSMDTSYSVFADADANVYTATQLGLRRLPAGVQEPELMLDSMAYSFGSPAYSLFSSTSTAVINEEEFIMLLYNWLDGSDKVVRLVYDAGALAYTGESIHVFSLYDDENVRLVISEYKRQHPEVEVVFEAGMGLGRTRYDGASDVLDETEVIKRLNTEVLTGNGPDVIFLDGLPAQSYAAKEALADLTGLLEDAGVMKEIAAALQIDGKNYFAPAYMLLPALAGSSGDLAQLSSLEQFFAAMENSPPPQRVEYRSDMTQDEQREYQASRDRVLPESERTLLDFDYWPSAYAMLYHVAAPGLYNYGESMRRDNLESFCRAMQYITGEYTSQNLDSQLDYLLQGPLQQSGGEYPYFEAGTGSFMVNQGLVCMVELSTFDWVYRLATGLEQAKTVYAQDEDGNTIQQPREGYQPPAVTLVSMPGFGGGGVCIPKVLMGINALSGNQEYARDFVRAAYTAEAQKYYPYRSGGGLPVVETVLASLENAAKAQPILYREWTGATTVEREIAYPAGIRYADVIAGVQQAYIPDARLEESVYKNVLQLCLGNITLEEAVENIMNETATYFAEQQ